MYFVSPLSLLGRPFFTNSQHSVRVMRSHWCTLQDSNVFPPPHDPSDGSPTMRVCHSRIIFLCSCCFILAHFGQKCAYFARGDLGIRWKLKVEFFVKGEVFWFTQMKLEEAKDFGFKHDEWMRRKATWCEGRNSKGGIIICLRNKNIHTANRRDYIGKEAKYVYLTPPTHPSTKLNPTGILPLHRWEAVAGAFTNISLIF